MNWSYYRENISDEMNLSMKLALKPEEITQLYIHYNPLKRGRVTCDIKITIFENPYEYFTVIDVVYTLFFVKYNGIW